MNITLDAQYSSPKVTNTDVSTNTYKTTANVTQTSNSGYFLDIADKVMDDEAYQGQGKTMEQIMQQAQYTDVQAQKNFMIVMSNSVSGEDLEKMAEEGFNPRSTDVETYVSMLDQIKVTLAKAGVDIAGFTDNLDADVVEEITGSRMDANMLCDKLAAADLPITKDNLEEVILADSQAQNLTEMSDDALKYMIRNHKEPTIENVYLAQYSSAANIRQSKGYYGEEVNGYYAKKADTVDFSQIQEQVDHVIQESDLIPDDETRAMAQWLVENGIELNKENLTRLSELKQISFPKSAEEVMDLTVTALANGKSAKDALLTGEVSMQEQAAAYCEAVENISQQAIQETIEKGEPLDLKHLTAAQKQIDEARQVQTSESEQGAGKETETTQTETTQMTSLAQQLKEVEAKAQLEEIRLMMSVEANKQLIKSGIQIDTAPLQELVEALKQVQEQLKAQMFQGKTVEENESRSELYQQTLETTKAISSMPAAVIGKAVERQDTFTLSYLHEEGTILQKQYTKAGETYEALMTAPRADLGDKITKAFQNVDEILKDMQMETSQENQRAVRILGYNRMEITRESIEAVKQADQTVSRVMNKMTPASTLQMIRDQKNPLEMDMNELEDYLNQQERQAGNDTERFSKYLQKLEHQNAITEEEKQAYMGVYRMFRQIEKSDGAVIGNIVATGAEMNFKNMLSAVRTKANKKMDVRVDEEYGSLEKLLTKKHAIDEQIMTGFGQQEPKNPQPQNQMKQQAQERYYAGLSGEITKCMAEDLLVEQLEKVELSEHTTIEHFSDELKEQVAANQSQAGKEEQVREQENRAAEFRKAVEQSKEVEESVLETLISYEQPVSIDNIEAATTLLLERGALFRKVFAKEQKIEQAQNEEDTAEDTTKSDDVQPAKSSALEDAGIRVIESLSDEKTAKTSYQELIEQSTKLVEASLDKEGVTLIDLKAAKALFKGLALAGNLAKEDNFEIPVTINGEITSVNLKIYHDQKQTGKVSVTMDTETYGKVAAEFDVTQKKISGLVVYDKQEASQQMKALQEHMEKQIEASGSDRSVSISFAQVKDVDFSQFGNDREINEEKLATKELYQTAKAFMVALKEVQ